MIDYVVGERDVMPSEHGRGFKARNYKIKPYGSYKGARRFEAEFETMNRDEIIAAAERREREESQIYHRLKRAKWPIKNQRSTNFCWCFGATSGVMVLRFLNGEPFIDLSPASVAAPLTNYRNRGGWGDWAFEGGERGGKPGGWVPSAFWPDTAIDRSIYERTKEHRKVHCLIDWLEFRPRDLLAVGTALVGSNPTPVPVGFNWWSHLVLAVGILPDLSLVILNSWGDDWGDGGYGTIKGERAVPDGAVAPFSMLPT